VSRSWEDECGEDLRAIPTLDLTSGEWDSLSAREKARRNANLTEDMRREDNAILGAFEAIRILAAKRGGAS
jgi:hypothetical protein